MAYNKSKHLGTVRHLSFLLVVAYAVSVLVYFIVCRGHPRPLVDSYTKRQLDIKKSSHKARGGVFLWALLAGCFVAGSVHVAFEQY